MSFRLGQAMKVWLFSYLVLLFSYLVLLSNDGKPGNKTAASCHAVISCCGCRNEVERLIYTEDKAILVM